MIQLYQPGEQVVHTSKKKLGKIVEFIGGDENRYYVQHSGWLWSVPQKYLELPRKKNNKLQGQNFLECPRNDDQGEGST